VVLIQGISMGHKCFEVAGCELGVGKRYDRSAHRDSSCLPGVKRWVIGSSLRAEEPCVNLALEQRKMDINDLKPGDVLLFSGEKGSSISEAIMFLTNSPVSHAALVYSDPNEVVEETPPSVQVNPAKKRFEGRTIYVNRLKKQPASLAPVIEAATRYVNNDEPYAMSNLYLVGLLLIYKRFTPSTPVQKAMSKILKRLAAKIIDYINKQKSPGKLPMVCSQFVYQCFEDAGGDYRIQIQRPVLALAATTPSQPSVLDLTIQRIKQDRSPSFRSSLAAVGQAEVGREPGESDEELAAELLQALRAETAEGAGLEDELVLAVTQFCHAAHASITEQSLQPEVLLRASQVGAAPDALGFFKSEEAYFVTPADLLDRTDNLTRVGTIP
jgi:hypothetical protein